jgi:hypothetical protein
MNMGFILPCVFLGVALILRFLHRKITSMITRARRTREFRAITLSIAGKYFSTLSSVFAMLSGNVTDTELPLEVMFEALYVMLVAGVPLQLLWNSTDT